MLERAIKHSLEKVLKILKHFKTCFVNMCTKWVNSKIFGIAMILFGVIGIMANFFNRPDIVMFFTICELTGLGLALVDKDARDSTISWLLTGQVVGEKISKRMTYREFYELEKKEMIINEKQNSNVHA